MFISNLLNISTFTKYVILYKQITDRLPMKFMQSFKFHDLPINHQHCKLILLLHNQSVNNDSF